MTKNIIKTITVSFTLILTACTTSMQSHIGSSVHNGEKGAMYLASLEAQVAPPLGLSAFCRRQPEACSLQGALPESAPAQSEPVMVAAKEVFPNSRLSTGAALGPAGKTDSAALFQALLGAKSGASSSANVSLQKKRTAITMDPDLWAKIRKINLTINRSIYAMEDTALYGPEDRWALPLTAPDRKIGAKGDCEDYALEKRIALIAAGVPVNALALVVTYKKATGVHAVLLLRTDRGDFLLDNLHREPVPIGLSGYSFLSAQSGPQMLSWSLVKLEPFENLKPVRNLKEEQAPERRFGDFIIAEEAPSQGTGSQLVTIGTEPALDILESVQTVSAHASDVTVSAYKPNKRRLSWSGRTPLPDRAAPPTWSTDTNTDKMHVSAVKLSNAPLLTAPTSIAPTNIALASGKAAEKAVQLAEQVTVTSFYRETHVSNPDEEAVHSAQISAHPMISPLDSGNSAIPEQSISHMEHLRSWGRGPTTLSFLARPRLLH